MQSFFPNVALYHMRSTSHILFLITRPAIENEMLPQLACFQQCFQQLANTRDTKPTHNWWHLAATPLVCACTTAQPGAKWPAPYPTQQTEYVTLRCPYTIRKAVHTWECIAASCHCYALINTESSLNTPLLPV